MTQVRRIGLFVVLIGMSGPSAGCDETTIQQAVRGLGISISDDGRVSIDFNSGRPAGSVNANDNAGNANANRNDNRDDGGRGGNTNTNTNDNTGNTNTNTNDNTGNTNTNSNTNDNNSNDNTSGGLCPDGSTRLEGSIDSPFELEAEYRLHPAGCERFRVKVRDYAGGTHEILVNGTSVGTITVGSDGRGEQEFDSEDGDLPVDFPQMQLGDVVQVGGFSVTMANDCSSTPDICNGNTNDNNSNTNTNTNDNNGNDNG